MVTGIIGSSSNQIQQLMAEMMKKMKSADTDGTSGLSKNELSSINTDNDPGGARFLKELSKNFDKIDSNSDGQLSKSEIDAAKPAKNSQMGPPPGMFINDISSSDTDGTSGLSKDELSSVDTGNDKGKANFIDNLMKNFDKIDSNSDGQLSQSEIEAAKPDKNSQMGPPPPPSMSSENTDSSSSSSSNSSQISSLLDLFTKQSLNSYSNNSDLNSSILSSLDVAV